MNPSHLREFTCDACGLIREIVHINPGQMPFITADQLPYATLKQGQWERLDDLGEDIFAFVLF